LLLLLVPSLLYKVVAELIAASSPEYDNRPPSEKWGPMLIWDASDESVCYL
jgi:hypothetical protein